MELTELKERQKEIIDLIGMIDQGRPVGKTRQELDDELRVVMNRISEAMYSETSIIPVSQEVATTAIEQSEEDKEISRAMEEIELFGVALNPYCKNNVGHMAIRSVVLGKVYDLMDLVADTEASKDREIDDLKHDAFELNDTISQLHQEIDRLKAELYETKLEAEANAQKRDNAYNELLGAQQTIDALNDKLSAQSTTEAPKRTNIEGPTAAVAKRAIYSVEDIDGKGRKFRARYADTDEEFESFYVYINAYREVTQADAESFRAEYLQTHPAEEKRSDADPAQCDHVEEQPVEVTPFCEEEPAHGPELAPETSAVVGQDVSREEFEALKERVRYLENPAGLSWQ